MISRLAVSRHSMARLLSQVALRPFSFIKKENIRMERELKQRQVDHFEEKAENLQELQDQIEKQLRVLQEEIEEKEEQVVHPQVELDQQIGLPYKLYGMAYDKEPKTSYMGDRVYAHHQLPKKVILSHLHKIYEGAVYSMAAQDTEFLDNYLEQGLSDKLQKSLKGLKDKGYSLEAREDSDRGIKVGRSEKIIDHVVIQGLQVDRKENLPREEYRIWEDEEDMGLTCCTPLHVTTTEHQRSFQENKSMFEGYKRAVYRILLEVQSPLRLVLVDPEGQEVQVPTDDYLWTHLVVFESQMVPPPVFNKQNQVETYQEWLSKFKFGLWKMADLDNTMQGNPLLEEDTRLKGYRHEIFKGSSFDREVNIDIRKV